MIGPRGAGSGVHRIWRRQPRPENRILPVMTASVGVRLKHSLSLHALPVLRGATRSALERVLRAQLCSRRTGRLPVIAAAVQHEKHRDIA